MILRMTRWWLTMVILDRQLTFHFKWRFLQTGSYSMTWKRFSGKPLFCRQCCVCKVHMVPPTKIIGEDDRSEMFLRRHINIPIGSRCCASHMIANQLSSEAFSSLLPYKVEDRVSLRKDLMNILESYRSKVTSKKHLDFDDCLSIPDSDYKILAGFTRAEHSHILSRIPESSLKNSLTRSARSALAYLLMKLKLGVSNSVLAAMVGVSDERQMGFIISSARDALVQHFVPNYLRLRHLTREEVIEKHTSPIASRLLTEGRTPCILVLDGTYLFIQVRYISDSFFSERPLSRIEKPKQFSPVPDVQHAEETVVDQTYGHGNNNWIYSGYFPSLFLRFSWEWRLYFEKHYAQ